MGRHFEGLDDPEHMTVVRLSVLLAGCAVIARIVFWVYTRRVWEDALITCLHSENFAKGLGMTHFHPGEAPLHGFTSPLSVLIPLMADLVRAGLGIPFLKLVSIPAGALTVWYLMALSIHPKVRIPAPLAVALMGYAAFEHQQILFGMAGMETQVATLILVMSVYYVAAWRPGIVGVLLGFCMLARPDFCFWTAIVGLYALWREPRKLPEMVGLALLVYLPWIVFTTWYYGSPLPHTIVAKMLCEAPWYTTLDPWTWGAFKRFTGITLCEQVIIALSPTFAGHGSGLVRFYFGGTESPLANVLFVFGLFGVAASFRAPRTLLAPALGALVYTLYYVYVVPMMGSWYRATFSVFLLITCVYGLSQAARCLPARPWRNAILWAVSLAYMCLFCGVLPLTFYTEKQIQRDIEGQVRMKAALYLHDRLQPGDTVGCEPLGYMSYYSGGEVFDWPGLASRRVTNFSEHASPAERGLEGMLHALQPAYIFLREMERVQLKDPAWLKEHYTEVQEFRVNPEAAQQIRWIDRNIDTWFHLYRQKDKTAIPPSAP